MKKIRYKKLDNLTDISDFAPEQASVKGEKAPDSVSAVETSQDRSKLYCYLLIVACLTASTMLFMINPKALDHTLQILAHVVLWGLAGYLLYISMDSYNDYQPTASFEADNQPNVVSGSGAEEDIVWDNKRKRWESYRQMMEEFLDEDIRRSDLSDRAGIDSIESYELNKWKDKMTYGDL